MGPSCETFHVSLSHPGLTLGLHAGPDQGQWVAGYLAARAGDGATGCPGQLNRGYTAGATGSSGSGRSGEGRRVGWS